MQIGKAMLAVCVLALPLAAAASEGEGDVELVDNMSQLQYFSHKAALSIDAENRQLVDFYVHELEEMLEQTESIESYDGHPIGELAGAMLGPAVEDLEDALDEGEWPAINEAYDGMINSCNACHQATEHGYIKVERSSENPYMQDFSSDE